MSNMDRSLGLSWMGGMDRPLERSGLHGWVGQVTFVVSNAAPFLRIFPQRNEVSEFEPARSNAIQPSRASLRCNLDQAEGTFPC